MTVMLLRLYLIRHPAFGKSARATIDTVAGTGDAATSDLFTEVSSGIDKLLWFVKAHAKEKSEEETTIDALRAYRTRGRHIC